MADFRVLIATTMAWPWPARLALEFQSLGARVSVATPARGPLTVLDDVGCPFILTATDPLGSLRAALRAKPDIVIPCDDRIVMYLHAIHDRATADDQSSRDVIARSLGDPIGYDVARERGLAMALAADAGVLEPRTRTLASTEEVSEWCGKRKFPLVLKADGSWGGNGVEIARCEQDAVTAFKRLSLGGLSAVVGQDFIRGRQANIMAACWKGEVIATASVKVLETAKELGVSTIVQPVQSGVMRTAACHMVSRLGMSGFCGLDFVIDDDTGLAYMIEINPRATQIGHLPLTENGTSLAGALLARARGLARPPERGKPIRNTIALFPQAWMTPTVSPLVRSSHQDIPVDEPALLAYMLRRLGDRRGMLSRIIDRALGRRTPERLLARFNRNQEKINRGT